MHTSFILSTVDTIVMYCPAWSFDTFIASSDSIDFAELQSAVAAMGITIVPFGETYYPGNVLTLAPNEILLICDIMEVVGTLDLNGFQNKVYFVSFQPTMMYQDDYLNRRDSFLSGPESSYCFTITQLVSTMHDIIALANS